MSAFNKFQVFVQDLGRKIHNLNGDTLKVMLTNVAPVNTNTVDGSLTEISAGNGYSAGGTAVGSTAYSQSGGTATLTGSNVVFTASGGSIGPARYAVIYNSTAGSASNRPLIGWWDYGSSITLATGETLTVDLSGGILTDA
jgi:hypothetical protein